MSEEEIHNCYYCNQPLSEKHYQHAKRTGEYQCTWKGDIACRKCSLLEWKERRENIKEAYRRLADPKRKRKVVPILSVPFDVESTLTRKGRRWHVKEVKVTMGKPERQ
jgi:hypothetical protein